MATTYRSLTDSRCKSDRRSCACWRLVSRGTASRAYDTDGATCGHFATPNSFCQTRDRRLDGRIVGGAAPRVPGRAMWSALRSRQDRRRNPGRIRLCWEPRGEWGRQTVLGHFWGQCFTLYVSKIKPAGLALTGRLRNRYRTGTLASLLHPVVTTISSGPA
jgi:hypothetical protein